MMQVVLIVAAILCIVIGARRTGFLFSLVVHAQQYEAYIGGGGFFSILFSLLPLPMLLYSIVKRPKVTIAYADIFLAAFCGLAVLSILLLSDPAEGLYPLARFFLLGPMLYLAIRYLVRDIDILRQFVIDFTIGLVALTLLFFLVAQLNVYGIRMAVGEGHAVGFSIALNASLAALIGIALATDTGETRLRIPAVVVKVVALALLLAVLHVTLLNGTRGALLGALGAGVCSVVALTAVRASGLVRVVLVSVVPLAALLALLALPVLAEWTARTQPTWMPARVAGALQDAAGVLAPGRNTILRDPSLSTRAESYAIAVDMIQDKPLVGHGFYGFQSTHGHYIHNLFLELLVDFGAIGAALFTAFLIHGGYLAFRTLAIARGSYVIMVPICVTIGTFIQMQGSLTLSLAKVLFIGMGLIVTCAVALGAQRGRVPTHALALQAGAVRRL